MCKIITAYNSKMAMTKKLYCQLEGGKKGNKGVLFALSHQESLVLVLLEQKRTIHYNTDQIFIYV
uniref:Uncharacterized protein n=1 Tax=Anguilla anguilla TaxID=7936 RepID=A0A0E9X6I7_ANGAN